MHKASASSSGRRTASVTTGLIAALLLSVFAFGGQAGAWVTPTLSANCAPDANSYAWTIDLHPESNQKIELSWGTGAFTAFRTTDFVSSGAHTFTTPRGGTTLVVRYASDKNVKTSAMANGQLCGTGTTNGGGTVAGTQQGPNGNNGDVKIHDTTTAVQDHRNEPHVCTFYVDGFNFDKAASGTWRIEQWAPTGSGVVATGSWGPADGNGNWHTSSMTLADGHYKLFVKQTGTPGGEKQKVFWVECGAKAGHTDTDKDESDKDSKDTGGTTGGTQQCTGVATLTDHSDISGATEGGIATVTFTMSAGCAGKELTLVSYSGPSATFSRDTASEQKIFEYKNGVFGTGTYTLAVRVPSCFFQIDFVYGSPIEHFGPAGSHNFYSDQGRLIEGMNGGTNTCTELNSAGGTGGAVVTPEVGAADTTTGPNGLAIFTPGQSSGSNNSNPTGTAVRGFESAPTGNAIGAVTPIVELPGGSDQQSANGANGTQAGVQTSPVAGVQSLPSTSTNNAPAVPLAALGLAIMALGGVLLRRRDAQT